MTCYVEKKWGHEEILYKFGFGQMKVLHVNPLQRLSLQFHTEKREALMLVKGEAWITLEEGLGFMTTVKMVAGQIFVVNPKMKHRVEAGEESAVIFEIANGDDADIVRVEDDYGRASHGKIQVGESGRNGNGARRKNDAP